LPRVLAAANTGGARRPARARGVARVGVGGGARPAVRVQVAPAVLAGLGIGLEDVRNALANATADQPKGAVGDKQWHTIGVDDQLLDADAWKNVIVTWVTPGVTGTTVQRGDVGAGIRLGDIATVKDDVENQRVAGWYDG